MAEPAAGTIIAPGFDLPVQLPVNLAPGDVALMGLPDRMSGPPMRVERFHNVFVNRRGEVFHNLQMLPYTFPPGHFEQRKGSTWSRFQKTLQAMKRFRHLRGEYVLVTDSWSGNYYHWMCNALPRLEALTQHTDGIALLLHARAQQVPFVTETLKAYPKTRLALEEPYEGSLWAQSLDIVTHSAIADFQHPALLAQVVDRLKAHFGADGEGKAYRRIYASRKRTTRRRVTNEEAILPVLDRHGFEVLDLEELTLADQIRLYAETEVLAGPHGAGLTNAMFMPRGGAVLEMRQIANSPVCFATLASVTGQGHFYLACAPHDEAVHHHAADLVVDPDRLDRVLGAMSRWLESGVRGQG